MNKQQLASKIWETANKLRSTIKANEYKDYIIGFMFYKYLSDNEVRYVEYIDGTIDDLKDDSAKEMIQDAIGYFIAYEDLFSTWQEDASKLGANVVKKALTAFNRNINPTYKRVFNNIFATLDSGLSKLGDTSGSRDKAIRDIVDLISDVPTTNDNYDVLGYIYEYLVYKFSTAAKDDGAFYTPHEVSSLISQIIADAMKDKTSLNVYDPTSGSGSLLLNIGKEASKYIDKDNIKYYGQEKITETYHLTRMNLVMKGIKAPNIFVRNGDTLEDDWPYFDEETSYSPLVVDAVVSNPPYSLNWNPSTRENDPRFKYGLAPSSKADYAFLLHCLYHLRQDGIMAIVLPHGVLFRGGEEGVIRKNLIENNHIETVIGLPSNLFYATGIPTIIMILRKHRTDNDILFIDASQNFAKEKTQNVLRESDIKRIFDAVKERKNIDNFARLVKKDEIVSNDYNLNIPRYVSATSESESYDLYSLMSGKVNEKELEKFASYWNTFDGLKSKLFIDNDSNGYLDFVDDDIKDIILNDDKVKNYKSECLSEFNVYKESLIDTLIKNIMSTNYLTKEELVNKLFDVVDNISLLDRYSIYQVFAENWDTIDNDLMTIRDNGLGVCRQSEPNMVVKKEKSKTIEEQKGWKGKLIPFDLVQTKFFTSDFDKMNQLQSDVDSYISEYQEIFDGLEDDVKALVAKDGAEAFDSKMLKAVIKAKSVDNEVLDSLKLASSLMEDVKKVNKQIKTINDGLGDKSKEKLEKLTDDEINELLEEKWLKSVINGFNNVLDSNINTFIKDIEALKNKYANPLSEIEEEIHKADEELFALMDELVGSETDMLAIQMLKEALK